MAELFPNQGGFDHDNVDDDGFDGSCLPPGEYVVRITNSSVESTRAGTGKYIVLEFTVDEGEFQNRKFWSNFNIVNPNAQAVKIGQQMLKRVCAACGVPSPLRNTDELHNIPFRATTKIQKSDGYDDKTELKNAKPYNSDAPKPNGSQKKQPAGAGAGAAQDLDDEVPW